MYADYLPTSLERAEHQGYAGARWGKMTDPTGRSAPAAANAVGAGKTPQSEAGDGNGRGMMAAVVGLVGRKRKKLCRVGWAFSLRLTFAR